MGRCAGRADRCALLAQGYRPVHELHRRSRAPGAVRQGRSARPVARHPRRRVAGRTRAPRAGDVPDGAGRQPGGLAAGSAAADLSQPRDLAIRQRLLAACRAPAGRCAAHCRRDPFADAGRGAGRFQHGELRTGQPGRACR
ncbi:hypothetical protein G6F61_014149 [Rhizopus arrhizus]|nr:hypothetical protein G6F32_015166 [Rhizopus arrhizus]KAG1361737.1 hypothetical protein G6F61_014149 [Rhizopus arrhizus]